MSLLAKYTKPTCKGEALQARIIEWNLDRNNLEFNPELEINMLTEEFNEFLSAVALVDQLDAIADYMFVTTGTMAKVHKAQHQDYTFIFKNLVVAHMDYMLANTYVKTNLSKRQLADVCLAIITEANERKGIERDVNGKVKKGKDYVPPEETLGDLLKELGYVGQQ